MFIDKYEWDLEWPVYFSSLEVIQENIASLLFHG